MIAAQDFHKATGKARAASTKSHLAGAAEVPGTLAEALVLQLGLLENPTAH